jgi:EmrB/QacA subfamily drug resistance transporter
MTRARHGWTLTVIAVVGFMATLDNTVVNVALPTIGRGLHVSTSTLEWVVNGYIVAFASLMLAGGRLADVYGCKRVFLSGVAVFTGASALAGMSRTAELLIASRIIQGTGAALLIPSGVALLLVGRSDKERSGGMAVWICVSAVAVAVGPVTGGYLVSQFHWNSIFLINIVPGILTLIAGFIVLPESRAASASNIDLPGLLATTAALFTLVYALIRCSDLVSEHRWPLSDPSVLAVFGVSAASVVAVILVEKWARDPMIDLAFFRTKAFSGGVAVQILSGVGFNGVLFFASIFMQTVIGFSPTETGAVFLPPAIITGVLTPLAFWIGRKMGARTTIGWGIVAMAAGMAVFTQVKPGAGYLDLLPGTALLAVGYALNMPLGVYALKGVPDDRAGVAGGILNVAREVSGALGIAIIGILITSRQQSELAHHVSNRVALEHATPFGLLVGAGLVLVGAPISFLTLQRRERRARHARTYSETWGKAIAPPPPAALPIHDTQTLAMEVEEETVEDEMIEAEPAQVEVPLDIDLLDRYGIWEHVPARNRECLDE